jgi:tRNA modification GTPase
MVRYNLDDTIAAIATPIGESGIGIVRISGKDALKVADKIFVSKDGKKPSEFKTYTTHYGWVVDEITKIIDEVILTVMRAPRSYTKEDIVEINCHGGIVALRAVLDLVLEGGCRLAEPGEFTQRAFLNGRIDLAQAEAVLDIIRAKTDSALKVGIEQLKGGLSQKINKIRDMLLEILTFLESGIDFPEEEIGILDLKEISSKLKTVDRQLTAIINDSKFGRVLREGLKVVICGRPNVGKSSLLNALLKQERSIVTPIPGTTRDTIEEVIDIKGIPIRIVDTAGILEPRDLIEKKAIQRTQQFIDSADLIILIFDGSEGLKKEDEFLMRKLKQKQKNIIAVINKMDLKQRIEKDRISRYLPRLIEISAKRIKNLTLLEDAIVNLVYQGRIKASESILVTNLRHIQAIKKVQKLVAQAQDSLDNKLSLEFIAQGIKDALGCIDELLGKKFSEDLLKKIFSQFCIGK